MTQLKSQKNKWPWVQTVSSYSSSVQMGLGFKDDRERDGQLDIHAQLKNKQFLDTLLQDIWQTLQ